MIKITIEAANTAELATQLLSLAGQFGETEPVPDRETSAAPKPTAARQSRKAATPAAETQAASPPADEVDRELLEEVPPAPTAAGQVVDAGTGKPAAQQVVEAEATEVKQMTMDDVRKAAAQLAAKDTDALKALLTKYGAPNLSGVPQDKLADFAGDVVAALG